MFSQTGGRQMNEREELKVANIMAKVLDMGLSKYHTLFLTQNGNTPVQEKYERKGRKHRQNTRQKL